jgi:hypothetical protein
MHRLLSAWPVLGFPQSVYDELEFHSKNNFVVDLDSGHGSAAVSGRAAHNKVAIAADVGGKADGADSTDGHLHIVYFLFLYSLSQKKR